MSNFEQISFDSSQPLDDEPGPLPLTAELLDSLLGYIKELWKQYDLLKQSANRKLRDELSQELYRAYTELDTSKAIIQQLDLPPQLQENAEFELWFSCHHLHKMLK